MECLGVACGLWAVQWLTGSCELCQCPRCQMCGVARAACQHQSAQLPTTPLYPIRHFDTNQTPILVSSCPPPASSAPPLSYLTKGSTSPSPGVHSPFWFLSAVLFPTLLSPRAEIADPNKWTFPLKISVEIQAHLEISLLLMCIAWRGGAALSVCLCVASLDMMRDDIMVDAAAASSSEMRKVPICLTLAESNVSICHSPQDRTLVFIKINILFRSKDLFLLPLFIY